MPTASTDGTEKWIGAWEAAQRLGWGRNQAFDRILWPAGVRGLDPRPVPDNTVLPCGAVVRWTRKLANNVRQHPNLIDHSQLVEVREDSIDAMRALDAETRLYGRYLEDHQDEDGPPFPSGVVLHSVFRP